MRLNTSLLLQLSATVAPDNTTIDINAITKVYTRALTLYSGECRGISYGW